MSDYIEVTIIVEGRTEQNFVRSVLAPYLGLQNIFLYPALLDKPGKKGGDVRFARAVNDIGKFLKQRADTFISLMVDYCGIGADWPGLDAAKNLSTPFARSQAINKATQSAVSARFATLRADCRFIPYVSMYEFEALLFSDAEKLAQLLTVNPKRITDILAVCKEPENINDSTQTAPSRRLAALCGRYKKTTTGITIAKAIGIDCMREKCPLFNQWLINIEQLKGGCHGAT